MATPEEVEKRLRFAQESLAQTGIKISKIDTVYFDVPKSVNLEDGLTTREQVIIAHAAAHLAPEQGLRIIFGGEIARKQGVNEVRGAAITKRSAERFPEAQNTVFLTATPLPPNATTDSIPGHELAHPIIDSLNDEDYAKYQLDETGHSADPKNLMHSGADIESAADGLFRDQQHLVDDKTLLNSPLLIDPPAKPHVPKIVPEYRDGVNFVPRP